MDTVDLWTKNHVKDKSYFEEIFYSLLDNGFELGELYLFYGKDIGDKIDNISAPTNGYKPAYRLYFVRIQRAEKWGYKVSELDEIAKLLLVAKSCCRRLQADLGPIYVDFEYDKITVEVVHEDASEATDINEDLISFHHSVLKATDIYNSSIRKEELNIIKTNEGLSLNVGHLSKGQMATLNKHIDKLQYDWQGWYNADRYKYKFEKHIDRKSKKMILTFIQKEKLTRNR